MMLTLYVVMLCGIPVQPGVTRCDSGNGIGFTQREPCVAQAKYFNEGIGGGKGQLYYICAKRDSGWQQVN
jgi:hypothetical protein